MIFYFLFSIGLCGLVTSNCKCTIHIYIYMYKKSLRKYIECKAFVFWGKSDKLLENGFLLKFRVTEHHF